MAMKDPDLGRISVSSGAWLLLELRNVVLEPQVASSTPAERILSKPGASFVYLAMTTLRCFGVSISARPPDRFRDGYGCFEIWGQSFELDSAGGHRRDGSKRADSVD